MFAMRLTEASEAQRKEMRRLARARFAHVNRALRKLYAERKKIEEEMKELDEC